ncbi:hypothetical protein FOXG_02646 [Fusarium oxysporum f. sp. lycopersici 4287]|uniref:Carboxylic ester hydrolase n=1 Tax=Fusarium oxysporum f. sp. lycopersici (strain 4287 / CBS 123668 / FGSC 9935 / NRRL 34936) TaxID=426428 RepID=A0A0J9UHE5_FUSO4|nr:hypothetical protein FOXG_02646 [Fusarium oxysporum f. sp. lycopersici 4287]KNA98257.1 hypothetical protein FOXG_02646 [Fusarium oxysporum f. sp. lycopersici 4287]
MRIAKTYLCLLTATSVLAPPVIARPSPSPAQPRVTIKNGTLVGAQNSEYHQDYFLGIPYALPPVGNLRFNMPHELNESWSTERAATAYGPFCRTAPLKLPGFSQDGVTYARSEDCLTLNIVRPSGLSSCSKVPVLVWIHGGGLQDGGSGDPRYNMTFLVKESVSMGAPIIGVSINYRISGWGFLNGAVVNASRVANLGLHDQRLALHWIHENIGAFGGDPTRITIHGESSGAISVGHHLLAYGGRDDRLFHAAIAQSGGPLSPSSFLTLDQQDEQYAQVLNATKCSGLEDTLGCLRSVSADVLDDAFRPLTFTPVIDGGLVPDFPSASLKEGKFVKVPLLIGANTNEGTPFTTWGGLGVDNKAEFMAAIKAFDAGQGLSDKVASDITEYYVTRLTQNDLKQQLGTVLVSPGPSYGALYGPISLYLGDVLFSSGRRYSLQAWHEPEPDPNPHHASIRVSVVKIPDERAFDVNPLSSSSIQREGQLQHLSMLMARMWLSFATTLSPNHHEVPNFNITWPKYQNDNPTNMVFRLENTTLEADNFRLDGTTQIIQAFKELKL